MILFPETSVYFHPVFLLLQHLCCSKPLYCVDQTANSHQNNPARVNIFMNIKIFQKNK